MSFPVQDVRWDRSGSSFPRLTFPLIDQPYKPFLYEQGDWCPDHVPISEPGFYHFVYRSLRKKEGEKGKKENILLS